MSNRIVLLASSLLLLSCAPEAGSPGGGPTDLVPTSLTASGCLDLGASFAQLRAMSPETRVRTSTSSVQLDGESLRRNFVGEISFSHYMYSEKSAAQAEWPDVSQTGCESLSMRSAPGGEQHFKIQPSEDPSSLVIERDDGYRMEWKLAGARNISVITTATIMDRCPQYVLAKATTTVDYRWGSPIDLSSQPITLSRSMLRAISMIVTDMPVSLLTLATFDTDDEVTASPRDLASLTKSTIDPETQFCPYRAEPPSGAEPPPPN